MRSGDGKHEGENAHDPDGVPRRRLSFLAIVAFVLGVVGPAVGSCLGRLFDDVLAWAYLGAFLGLVVSAVALVRLLLSGGMLKKNESITLAAAGFISALIWAAALPMQPSRSKGEGQRVACRSNLRQIGTALQMYAEANGGWTPAIEPEARRIANAAGLPAGCVVTFKEADGRYKATGLGLL